MAYEFTDMTQVGIMHMNSGVQTIFDGINLDNTLSDVSCTVMTLNVTGRSTADYEYKSANPDMLDGELFQSVSLKARALQIEIMISAKDNATLLRRFEQLNAILRKPTIAPIKFTDENDRYYFGIYTGSDKPKEDSIEMVLTLDFICPSPFKVTADKTINYTNSASLSVISDYPVQPYIEISYSGTSTTLDILNTTTNKLIKLTGLNPSVEQIYKVDVSRDKIYKSNTNINGFINLVITSDWEDFTIKTGDQIVITPTPSSIVIKYKGVFL